MIPQELFDHIIGEVAQYPDIEERRSALKACSLSSWSLLAPSRRILFQHVVLPEDPWDGCPQEQLVPRLEEFLNLLRQNPSLGINVRSVAIELGTRYPFKSRRLEDKSSILPSVLDCLSHVESLTLFPNPKAYYRSKVPDVHLMEALSRFCASKTVTQLKLLHLNGFPKSFITSFSDITSLHISDVDFAKCTPNFQTTSQTLPKLKTLSIDTDKKTSIEILLPCAQTGNRGCLSAYLDLSTLQRLDISSKALRNHGLVMPSVRYLCVTGYDRYALYEYDPDGTLGVGKCLSFNNWRNLQVLEINWVFGHTGPKLSVIPLISPGRFQDPTSPQSVAQCLSIDTLILNISYAWLTRKNEMEYFRPSAEWHGVDSTLTSPTFPNLRTIKLHFNLEYTSTSSTALSSIRTYLLEKIGNQLPELLPSVSASNMIQVELDIKITLYG